MNEEQVFEIARTLKFNVHLTKPDNDYAVNSDEEEVHAQLVTNSDFHQWTVTYPGLTFSKVSIVSHNRSKLTGPPLPERVFNKIKVRINFPKTSRPIDIN